MRKTPLCLLYVAALLATSAAFGEVRDVPPAPPPAPPPPAVAPAPAPPAAQPVVPPPVAQPVVMPTAGRRNGRVLYVGEANAPAVTLLTDAGVAVETAPALPANYLEYSCLVLEKADCNPSAAEKLYYFLKGANGVYANDPGGVVLIGGAPMRLAGSKHTRDDAGVQRITGWFGAVRLMHEQKLNVYAHVNRPFDLDIPLDQQVEEVSSFSVRDLSDDRNTTITMVSDSNGGQDAFSRRIWGGGRLYYQGGVYARDGKLRLMLPAAVRWAAGKLEVEGLLDEAPAAPAPANRTALYVGSPDALAVRVLRDYGGFRVRTAAALPDDTAGDTLVVLEEAGCDARAAAAIENRLNRGGGVLLIGAAPALLCGATDTRREFDLKPIRSWFPFARFRDVKTIPVYTSVQKPFGLPIAKDTQFEWAAAGLVDQDGDPALETALVKVLSDSDGRIGGFARALGQARLYYQTSVGDERTELKELLAAGARWAAGIIEKP